MFLLWHPSLTAINLSYTFPILETSATALCGTTGTNNWWPGLPCRIHSWQILNTAVIQIFARMIDTKVEEKQHSNKWWTWSGYCWWKESCTTWDVWNPVNSGINYLSTGAGFFPSTVSFLSSFLLPAYSICDLLIPEMEITFCLKRSCKTSKLGSLGR